MNDDTFERGLYCPCCQTYSRVRWYQTEIMPGRGGYTQTHCQNSACLAHEMTRTEDVFLRKARDAREQGEWR